MKITDAIVLGGVAVAGYMVMKNTGGGGTSPVRYITRVPRTISPVEKPVTKEPQSVPMIINLPSESVTFPAPKLPSVTSLLPPIPSEEPKTPTVTAVTKTPAPTKKEKTVDYTKPSPESWREYCKEVKGSLPGQVNPKTGGTIASFSEIQRFGMPRSYLEWLKYPYSVPAAKKEIERKEIIGIFDEPGEMLRAPKSLLEKPAKKETKKEFPSTPIKPYTYAKTKPAKATSKKKTKEKRPPALPGITWKRSGSGWIPVRS